MNKSLLLLSLFILAKCLLQFWAVHPGFELHRDEFLHLDQADHLAWGYLSVPPFTSWVSVIIRALGNSEFWVRFFPAFFGVLTLIVVWDLVKRLGGGLFARSLATICLLCSALIRLNILYQPNSFDILAWTLVFYTLIRFVQSQEKKWLYFLALSFALGILNKYSIGFLALGLLPALLISKRELLREKHLYGAAALAFILILPNLIWQTQNDIPFLTHMRLLSKYQLVNNSRAGFLSEQALFFYPSLWVWVLGLLSLLFSSKNRMYRWIAWTVIFTLALFTFFQAKGYYAIGLYPVLIGIGAIQWESWMKSGWKKQFRPALLVLPPVLFFPAFGLIHPFHAPEKLLTDPPAYSKLGLNRWEDGKEYPIPQDFADMLGWKELASLVDSAYQQMPKEGRILIICDNYGQAGAINFYSKTPGLQALTMNADYLFWFDLEEKVEHLILVWEKDEVITDRETGFFEEYREIGKITHPLAREKGTTVHFLRGAKVDINDILKEEVSEEKKVWRGN
ncbi:dolichyl-phosphate-mannose-protein mannosyltransferase [Algoriphagus aquaeductus]|uniref:Dolichyl-phosphate-mannose-protein mannosyltransferase n=1 Tax=Algoriphagus aquaeductus TaxID=475299 RepID=A0A326RW61_9BACT|nr:glycosyltransferase family 39 protein [Algoriphagus aquaeductus]PZV85443.1 dolichyl-phosphate-mannose-protein mannosyltransferase [Algoriphagus aquaeductus]